MLCPNADEKAVQRPASHEGSVESRKADGISGLEWFAATAEATVIASGGCEILRRLNTD